MMWMLIDDGDSDGDRKLNLQDVKLILENPDKVNLYRYCAMKWF